MSDELENFTTTINKLKHLHADTKLSYLIAQLEPSAKTSQHFLIKMEIKRLAQPTKRIVDLRDVVKPVCKPTERGGVTHFLDHHNTLEFDREMRNYGNNYTVGVFEHIQQYAKNHNNIADKSRSGRTKLISIGHVDQRTEERIYFTTALSIYFTTDRSHCEDNKPDLLSQSTDISENGLTIKVEDPYVIIPDEVMIKFAGLEREYLMPQSLFVRYTLYKKYVKDSVTYAVFTLHDDQPKTIISECKELIKRCFHNHKRRNRVPVENTVEAVENRIFEQYVIGRQKALPVLLRINGDRLTPLSFMATPDNNDLRAYLSASNGRSILPYLFDNKWIDELVSSAATSVQIDVFVFKLRDKQKQLRVAYVPLAAVRDDLAMKRFVLKAHAKQGVKLIRLHLVKTNTLKSAYIPSSIPDSVGEAFATLNREPEGKIKKLLGMCEFFSVIEDLSACIDVFTPEALRDEASGGLPDMSEYVLEKRGKTVNPAETKSTHGEQRVEDRFVITFPVELTGRKRDKKDKLVAARTINISSRGMHVESSAEHPFEEGDDLFVQMTLSLTGKERSFSQQRYKVIRAEGRKLWLAVAGNIALHDARLYLKDALYHQADALTLEGDREPIYGLGKAMRNLYASLHPQLFATYARAQQSFFANALITSRFTRFPVYRDDVPQHVCINKLCQHEVVLAEIKQQMKALHTENDSTAFYIVAVARKNKAHNTFSLIVEVVPAKQPAEMIANTTKKFSLMGQSNVFKVGVHALAPISDKLFKDELRYLQKFAKAKHAKCLDITKQTKALVDIVDVTHAYHTWAA
ncbi:PilZ domain-containing protein [Aestuariibacter sp. AA17]|uniref:PilZ domain-containing protein n=1 Tax=Fluctibacter corallii TaxID=2984329 RepID=A0ABT3AC07_9ALTE|nr:PilZ domain-containing protein [Aestuariibacter sp. AA17]MCV2886206.1 PilZ domain-containing protein [Aestuariibacter sp. AA17]